MAQWLLQICPTINISANNEQAFRYACIEGYLEVAKWLLQVCPNIHISAYNEEAFRWACVNGHLEVAKWLHQMKPYLYVIEYDENGKINNYHIRSKEEANWQKRKYLVWLASNECPDENKNNLLYKLPSDVSRMVIGFV
jgi:ankyrin repeat protein